MASKDRPKTDSVKLYEALKDSPFRYDFFNALRMIESKNPELPRIGTSKRLADDPLRLGQDVSMAFAPSALSSFQAGDEDGPSRLGVKFLGLFGPNGPLPLHLTEYARNRMFQERDPTLCAFLDIFHHRILSMFYRAWAEAQPTVQFERPSEDSFSTYVGSTFGLALPSSRSRDEMPDLAKLYYSGRLACQTKHPEGLRALIEGFFKLPTEIEEFVGRWLDLPESCLCALGRNQATTRVGETLTLGSQIWDCHHHIRIVIGPLKFFDYERLLPGGASVERLSDLVKNYIGDELTWELNLILKKDETPSVGLGNAGQLGLTAWVNGDEVQSNPNDLRVSRMEDS